MDTSQVLRDALMDGLMPSAGIGRTILFTILGVVLAFLLLRLWLFFRGGGGASGV